MLIAPYNTLCGINNTMSYTCIMQLGNRLGNERLHNDEPKQRKQLWDCHQSQLPHYLSRALFLPREEKPVDDIVD